MRRSTSLRDPGARRGTLVRPGIGLGGTSWRTPTCAPETKRTARRSIPAAAALIALILALLLRSPVAPLFLLISVGLGFAATLRLGVCVPGHRRRPGAVVQGADPGLPVRGGDRHRLQHPRHARVREEVADGAEPRQAVGAGGGRPDRRRGRGHPGGHLRLADDLGRQLVRADRPGGVRRESSPPSSWASCSSPP